MSNARRGLVVLLLLAITRPAGAQIVVHDPAVIARNSVTAVLKEYLLNVQRAQREQLDRMARRLSQLTNLDKYRVPDTPEWRIHDFWDPNAVLYARDYNAALNYGDPCGAAYLNVTVPAETTDGLPSGLGANARRTFTTRLATVDTADATLIAATNDAGQLRYNGRRVAAAIQALEQQVTDPSQTQSTTAVLDKLTGAVLIGARQRHTRMELLTDLVDQLLVDTKRRRDAEAGALDMQITTWEESQAANDAFVDGTGDALSSWHQP